MSPVTWYAQKQTWDLSPGYEKGSIHFDRPIDPDCLFCHSNRVQHVALSVNRPRVSPGLARYAIGCERCHGPGELHARRPELSGGRDLTIVNPRHLDPVLRGNVCEQCHLVGEHRVDRLGLSRRCRHRPGSPLSAFFVDHARNTDEGQKLVGQVEQDEGESRCFRASRGRLGCLSCHDPHEVPEPSEKVAYFRERCPNCWLRGQGLQAPRADAAWPGTRRLTITRRCCHMPVVPKTVDAIHDRRQRSPGILREPDARSTGPGPWSGSLLPLVRLNGDADPDHRDSMDRELAIAVTAEGTRLPNTPQMAKVGGLVLAMPLDRAGSPSIRTISLPSA